MCRLLNGFPLLSIPGGSSDDRKRAKQLYETVSSGVSKDVLDQMWGEGAGMKVEDLEADILEK